MIDISVIMGVYNCSSREMLNQAINSVLNQTCRDFEFIICDDGSTNGTYTWICDIAKRDTRIKVLQNECNEGLAIALNRCIEKASGRYIARQDVDDISMPNRLKIQSEYLNEHSDIAFVGTDCFLYDENGIIGKWNMIHSPSKNDFVFNSPFVHGTIMFRRELFEKCGEYNSFGRCKKYEDYELFMRAYSFGLHGANINLPLYSYYFEKHKNKVSLKMRVDEYEVRKQGFRILSIPFCKRTVFALKPLAMLLVPNTILNKLREKRQQLYPFNAIEIAEKLCQADIVSFDIFDTLILRPFDKPADMFDLVGEKLDYPDFREIRIKAEKSARTKKNAESVNIKDIYNLIFEETGIDPELGQEIEMNVEYDVCFANPAMKDVWKFVIKSGKKIILTSDMYLSSSFIKKILKKNGYEGFEEVFISNEYGCGKNDGMLYEIIKDTFGTSKISHIGDNYFSDVKMARLHGFTPYIYRK